MVCYGKFIYNVMSKTSERNSCHYLINLMVLLCYEKFISNQATNIELVSKRNCMFFGVKDDNSNKILEK